MMVLLKQKGEGKEERQRRRWCGSKKRGGREGMGHGPSWRVRKKKKKRRRGRLW